MDSVGKLLSLEEVGYWDSPIAPTNFVGFYLNKNLNIATFATNIYNQDSCSILRYLSYNYMDRKQYSVKLKTDTSSLLFNYPSWLIDSTAYNEVRFTTLNRRGLDDLQNLTNELLTAATRNSFYAYIPMNGFAFQSFSLLQNYKGRQYSLRQSGLLAAQKLRNNNTICFVVNELTSGNNDYIYEIISEELNEQSVIIDTHSLAIFKKMDNDSEKYPKKFIEVKDSVLVIYHDRGVSRYMI